MVPVAMLVCLCLLFLILQQAAPRIGRHEVTFLGFNLLFIALVMPAPALPWLGAFLVIGYGFIAAAGRWRGLNPAFFSLAVVLIFAIFKKYEIFPLQPLYAAIPEILGISYIVFRVLTVLVEAHDTGRRPDILSYANYCLSMFTFLSGPIQRHRSFIEDMQQRRIFRLEENDAAFALTRFMNGVMKVIFIAPRASGAQMFFMLSQKKITEIAVRGGMNVISHGPFERLGDMASPLGFGLAAISYLIFLYFNFSGYTDMMIGLGRLFGFRLPENFDNPFAATGFIDFWKRWHISLSLWFRDYCFTPILKRMVKAGITNPAVATLPAYFISFGLLGLWHGRTWPFILCGLMFAVGSSANHFYRAFLGRRMKKETFKKLNENRVYQALTSAVTFFYIAIAIAGLWLSGPDYIKVWHSFSAGPAVLSCVLIIAGGAVVLYLGRRLWQTGTAQKKVILPVRRFFDGQSAFFIAAKIFLAMIWFFVFSTNLPDFVYQGF